MTDIKKRNVMGWALLAAAIIVLAFGLSTYQMMRKLPFPLEMGGERFPGAGDVAILEITGAIMDPEDTLAKLRELEEKKGLKAVVVRIDSPGGAVGPSQEIYNAVMRLRDSKKVVCSLGDLAASGGYYIASSCEKIMANPGTLTGSIGVIMHFMNLKDLYAWAKVSPVTIKAGRYKDIGSESRAMTDEEHALLQDMINDVHRQFKEDVLAGRNGKDADSVLKRATIEAYADGRVFSGARAKELGFVDELGGEYEAVELAADMAGIEGEPQVIRESDDKVSLRGLFDGKLADNPGGWIEGLIKDFVPARRLNLLPGVPYLFPPSMVEGLIR